MLKPLVFTGHARTAIDERQLDSGWVENAARAPEWETPTEIRILSAFLDRRARKPA